MSEQTERWACVRESDTRFFLAIKPALEEDAPDYRAIRFRAGNDQGDSGVHIMREGSQLFSYDLDQFSEGDDRGGAKTAAFMKFIYKALRNLDEREGPVYFDSQRSHVSELVHPQPPQQRISELE